MPVVRTEYQNSPSAVLSRARIRCQRGSSIVVTVIAIAPCSCLLIQVARVGCRRAPLLAFKFKWCGTRYTTLLRAVELWGAVQADGPGRLAGDEEPPAVDGFVVGREENFSQQIKANPEDRLSTAFVGLEDDGPVFRLPITGRVGERKSHGQHSEKLADPVGVNHVGILEIEAPRLGGREERFDRPPPPVMGQGDLGIGVGGDYKQVSADQPRRSPFQGRSKRAVA